MRVLVTGSTGFIGRHLVPRLLDEGDEVFALARGPDERERAGVETVSGPSDLALLDEHSDWPDGLDAVIHLAALMPEGTGTSGAVLMHANRDGTAALARLAAARGVGRFIHLSSASVHGRESERPVVEEDACNPADAYAASKLAAEDALRDTFSCGPTRYTILRPAPVYGADAKGSMAALAGLAAGRAPLPLAGFTARRSVLAVDNLVDALLLARSHPAGERNETFLLADDDPPTAGELVEMMRTARNRPPRLYALSPALAKAALSLSGNRGTAERWARSFVVDASRIRLRMGWRPPVPTRVALAKSLGRGR